MKKLLISLFAISSLYAADHALYTHSVEALGGIAVNSHKSHIENGMQFGIRYNYNVDTFDVWEIGAYQLAYDHSFDVDYDNGSGKTSIERIGANLLWYADDESEITPFLLLGAGYQFVDNESGGQKDSFFGAAGGGVEYQIRGDTAIVAEGKWLYSGKDDNYFLTNIGIKYSFGN